MMQFKPTPDLALALADAQAENRRLLRIIELKDEQIRLLNIQRFGPKGEKLSALQGALLLEEPGVSAPEVAREAQLPQEQKDQPLPRAKQPRPNHPGREPLPEHLERREEIIPCCPEDCTCEKCGAQRPVIGYETREELACEPAKFWVRVIKREKRGSHCQEEQGVATAPAPAQIVPKGKLSNQFIIEVLVRKYQLHLPVYRQCAALAEDFQIDLSRKTLTDAILAAGGLLQAVVRAQRLELLSGGYIQADETTVPCQTGERTGRNHRAFIWEFSEPGGRVVFEFQWGRGRDAPREFLQGFRGKLQSDGYGVYDKLGEGIVYVGCMAHTRRGFVDMAKLAPLDPVPPEVLGRFAQLYAVEKEAREGALLGDHEQAQGIRISPAQTSDLSLQMLDQNAPGHRHIGCLQSRQHPRSLVRPGSPDRASHARADQRGRGRVPPVHER